MRLRRMKSSICLGDANNYCWWNENINDLFSKYKSKLMPLIAATSKTNRLWCSVLLFTIANLLFYYVCTVASLRRIVNN